MAEGENADKVNVGGVRADYMVKGLLERFVGNSRDSAKYTTHAEMVFRPEFTADDMREWPRERVWSAVNALREERDRSVRKYMVRLPLQLGDQENIELTRRLAKSLITDHNKGVVDIEIHDESLNSRKYSYAHLLTTDIKVTPAGVSRDGLSEHSAGWPQSVYVDKDNKRDPELRVVKAQWTQLVNEAVRDANARKGIHHPDAGASITAEEVSALGRDSREAFRALTQGGSSAESAGSSSAQTEVSAPDRGRGGYDR